MGSDERVGFLQRSGLVEDSDLLCVENFYDSRSVLLSEILMSPTASPISESFQWDHFQNHLAKRVWIHLLISSIFLPQPSPLLLALIPFLLLLFVFIIASPSHSSLYLFFSLQPPYLSLFREKSGTILSSQCKLYITCSSGLSKRIGGDLGISRVFTWVNMFVDLMMFSQLVNMQVSQSSSHQKITEAPSSTLCQSSEKWKKVLPTYSCPYSWPRELWDNKYSLY